MIQKTTKRLTILFLLFFLDSNLLAVEDSDIFFEAVFFTAVKKSNYEKVMEMFEKGVSANILDSDDMSPIGYALINDDQRMFDLLIKNDANINLIIQKKTSHLTFYIKSQRSKLLKSLIAYGSDLNFRDNTGMTPMMHAIENVNIDAVNILLESDIEMDLTDYSGKTIFDYAKNSRNNYLRKLIISTDKNF
jgi:ankyrin repeat protein|tara:strand:+ start:9571 stop:10143 length:573 start_codon:yes stop_codon:yes gene_type:complete